VSPHLPAQVDPNLDVVKGRGGALLREKVRPPQSDRPDSADGRALQALTGLNRGGRDNHVCDAKDALVEGWFHEREWAHSRPPHFWLWPSTDLVAVFQAALRTEECRLLSAFPQMVEMASDKFVCIVDDSKLVEGLGGSKLAMPVEIVQVRPGGSTGALPC
jgi:hypothetical protein